MLFGVLASIAAVLLSMGIAQTGSGLFGSLIGLRMSAEGFADGWIGAIGAAHFIGLVVGAVYCQPIIKRVGHIRAFAAFAAISAACTLFFSFFIEAYGWLALRLIIGFCAAGLFMTAESWLNSASTNQTRGQILSAYVIALNLALAGGQLLLNLAPATSFVLFAVASIAFSLSLVPLALTRRLSPSIHPEARLSLRELYEVSPLGVLGALSSGLVVGAVQGGLAAVFASRIGLATGQVSLFVAALFAGGLVLMWPFGKISDRVDRRLALVAAGGLLAVSSAGVAFIDGGNLGWLLVLAALVGGSGYAIYPIALAHANDFMEIEQIVPASGAMVLISGVGASIGPLLASFLMAGVGPTGLFLWTAAVGVLLIVFAFYRRTVRPSVPADEQSAPYVSVPRTTPMAVGLDPRGTEEQLEFDFDAEPEEEAQFEDNPA